MNFIEDLVNKLSKAKKDFNSWNWQGKMEKNMAADKNVYEKPTDSVTIAEREAIRGFNPSGDMVTPQEQTPIDFLDSMRKNTYRPQVKLQTQPTPIPPKEEELIKQLQPNIQAQQKTMGVMEPTQKPQPTNAPGVDRYYNVKKYDVDNGGDGNIAQPPSQVHELANKYFTGDDVEKAVITSLFESNYNANRNNADPKTGKIPKSGEDRGLMQINENTFKDYMRRMPKELSNYGITSFDDMWNPDKNMAMASIIHKYQNWDAWYGPARNGYNIYSSQDVYNRNRGAVEKWVEANRAGANS